MSESGEQSHDGSSIKPVSSLRSHFESMAMLTPGGSKTAPAPSLKRAFGRQAEESAGTPSGSDVRTSLDTQNMNTSAQDIQGLVPSISTIAEEKRPPPPPLTPKPRPLSINQLSPPRSPRSPPLVKVDSPRSPPAAANPVRTPAGSVPPRSSAMDVRQPKASRSHSPLGTAFQPANRAVTPSLEGGPTPFFPTTPTTHRMADPTKSAGRQSPVHGASSQPGSVPPPINRAAKPKAVPLNQANGRRVSDTLAAPVLFNEGDEKISPFSTPPSEPEDISEDSIPPAVPDLSKLNQQPPSMREGRWSRTPDRNLPTGPTPSLPFRPATASLPIRAFNDRNEDAKPLPPNLPPRRDGTSFAPLPSSALRNRSPKPPHPPPEPPVRRSMDQTRPMYPARTFDSPPRSSLDTSRTVIHDARPLIPARRTQPASAVVPVAASASKYPPPPPPPRSSGENKRETPSSSRRANYTDDSDDDYDNQSPERPSISQGDYPDTSQASRRPPRFPARPWDIATKYDCKLFAVCGEYVCTTGYITKVWSIRTGQQLMNLGHAENVKATAVAFKPARSAEDEGKRVWIGTNQGELIELDIPSQSVVLQKALAHNRGISKIHRHASTMWSLDEDGKLLIWPPGEDGTASLEQAPVRNQLPLGITFSMVVGNHLWFALSKAIWVFSYDSSSHTVSRTLPEALKQERFGDVTACTIVSGQQDVIYFGHADGNITMYSRKDYSFIGHVPVSLYKISALAGAGQYLWAGFNTGMIYVYNTTVYPWKCLKDWKAHEGMIAGVRADASSMWKLDRLQVVSLGTDGALRIWDGMMTEDWLETDLQAHDLEFCDFKEVTAAVLTWNAGAAKPSFLRSDEQDSNFFRNYLLATEAPDIVVFGFQELVDLEDKKVTAKSFFKKHKKKDQAIQEHMSHQYRAWKDHLARSLDENLPEHGYALLHTANLVGLFTCIFVKSKMLPRLHSVQTAQVKLGMGGALGNKGALVVRFMVDDSSLCFLNCHLAAGQKHTQQRNNNAAAIMEASCLPAIPDVDLLANSFVGGGDGSMVLDHEICILNGDLNYRIDNIPRDSVIQFAQRGQLDKLLDRDQLLLSRKRNPGFRLLAFEEKAITFAPTYKYDVGTDVYDSSEKKRSPAWCDRILYRGLGKIKMEHYRRWEVRVSDHRPVSGRFKIRVKTVIPAQRELARQAVQKRFEAIQEKIAYDVKLEYLINVLGMTKSDAARSLQ